MKIQTFSILAGSEACNARCPFCVSKMTPPQGMTAKEPEVNWRNFHKAAKLARQSDVSTAMITGKGEPTLFPEQVGKYMSALVQHDFPFIEIQTNGLGAGYDWKKFESFYKDWYDKGMTTVALSIVHHDSEKNRQIYTPYKNEYMDLPKLIDNLHGVGLSVRLGVIMVDGYTDSVNGLEEMVAYSKKHNVEQLSFRPVNKPSESRDGDVYEWTLQHHLKPESYALMQEYVAKTGHKLLEIGHGAIIYDLHGQNVCMTNSLTRDSDPEKIRQLIFFPDGHLRYDWEYPGAILI